MMMVLVLSRTPSRLRGVVTRWLLEVQEGVYVGNVSSAIRQRIWQRVLSDIGKGRALLVWPGTNEQGLEFVTHNHDWEIVDWDGLKLVRKPTTDETQHRRALELYSSMSAPEINQAMAKWLRKNHPQARVPRQRTMPARLDAVRGGQGKQSSG